MIGSLLVRAASILLLLHFAFVNATDCDSGTETKKPDSSIALDKGMALSPEAPMSITITGYLSEADCKTGGAIGLWGLNKDITVGVNSKYSFKNGAGEYFDCGQASKSGDLFKITKSIDLKQYQFMVYAWIRIGALTNAWTEAKENSFLRGDMINSEVPDSVKYWHNWHNWPIRKYFPPPPDTGFRYLIHDKQGNITINGQSYYP